MAWLSLDSTLTHSSASAIVHITWQCSLITMHGAKSLHQISRERAEDPANSSTTLTDGHGMRFCFWMMLKWSEQFPTTSLLFVCTIMDLIFKFHAKIFILESLSFYSRRAKFNVCAALNQNPVGKRGGARDAANSSGTLTDGRGMRFCCRKKLRWSEQPTTSLVLFPNKKWKDGEISTDNVEWYAKERTIFSCILNTSSTLFRTEGQE